MGAGSFVSRCIGQGRREAARRAASTAFFAALGLSALLLAAGLLFAAPVLRLLGAPESAVAAGLPYARAVFVSGPPLCGALVLSSLLRAQGKTLPNMAAALVALSGSLSLLSARRDCVFSGGRSGLLHLCTGAGRPFRAGRAGRRGRAPRAPPAKRRLSRTERRHFDDHAHAGHGAHPPRLARRHQPSGALLSPPAGDFAASFRPLGAACVPERQRFGRARLFARADAGA